MYWKLYWGLYNVEYVKLPSLGWGKFEDGIKGLKIFVFNKINIQHLDFAWCNASLMQTLISDNPKAELKLFVYDPNKLGFALSIMCRKYELVHIETNHVIFK